MCSAILYERDLLHIINGTTILGAGGGGSASAGKELLEGISRMIFISRKILRLIRPQFNVNCGFLMIRGVRTFF